VTARTPLPGRAARQLLIELGTRVEAARRLEGGAGQAVLRSIVEATVNLFQAHAASIALYDPTTDRLVYRVAAGEQGQGVIGLSIRTDQGIAGYVYTTGQALALSDVANDARFGRAVAEKTAYIPNTIVAVPLVDEERTIGVLSVLDKRDSASFSLRDMELAGVFARQAAIAITASRVERDTAALLAAVLEPLAGPNVDPDAMEDLVRTATSELGRDDQSGLWRLVDLAARLRSVQPEQVGLVADLLTVLVEHSERNSRRRHRGRSRSAD